MSEKVVKPVPEEDLGRGGDAAVSFPAGSPGAREAIARGLLVPLDPGSPRPLEPELPPSALK